MCLQMIVLMCRTVGKPWLRTENNGNHFQDVILSPGDKTRIEFNTIIGKHSNSAGQVCLKFLYIKYGKQGLRSTFKVLLQQFTMLLPIREVHRAAESSARLKEVK